MSNFDQGNTTWKENKVKPRFNPYWGSTKPYCAKVIKINRNSNILFSLDYLLQEYKNNSGTSPKMDERDWESIMFQYYTQNEIKNNILLTTVCTHENKIYKMFTPFNRFMHFQLSYGENELYFDNINVGITVYIPSAFYLPINIWHRINHNDFNNGVLDLCLYDMLYELKCEIFDKLGEV